MTDSPNLSGLMLSLLSASCLPLAYGQSSLGGWTTAGVPNVLALAAVENGPSTTTFSLQNIASKTVRAFAFSYCTAPGVAVENLDFYGPPGAGIAPAAVYQLRTSNYNLTRCSGRTLDVLAVIFGDGTSIGLQREIASMEFRRLGRMLEVERIHQILNSIGAPQGGDPDLTSLYDRIGKLPDSAEAAFASVKDVVLPRVSIARLRTADAGALYGFSSGVQHTREGALNELKRLLELPAGLSSREVTSRSAALESMRARYRTMSVDHHAFCEQLRGGLYQ